MLTTETAPGGRATGRLAAPVIVTGAMRPLFEGDAIAAGTDAVANAKDALDRAADQPAGTWVTFAGQTHLGARVAKVHTAGDNAFLAPNGDAPLDPLPASSPRALGEALDLIEPHFGQRAVLTVTASPADPADHTAALGSAIDALGTRLGAIHLLGYGSGNVPARQALTPILAAAAGRGVLIAIGTSVPAGPVAAGTYAAGAWLVDLGAVGTADMTIAAANAKLHVTLARAALHGWTREQALVHFMTSVAGEIGG